MFFIILSFRVRKKGTFRHIKKFDFQLTKSSAVSFCSRSLRAGLSQRPAGHSLSRVFSPNSGQAACQGCSALPRDPIGNIWKIRSQGVPLHLSPPLRGHCRACCPCTPTPAPKSSLRLSPAALRGRGTLPGSWGNGPSWKQEFGSNVVTSTFLSPPIT